MRTRLAVAIAALFLALLVTPAAAATLTHGPPTAVPGIAATGETAGEALRGTLEGPQDKPLEGVTLTVLQDGNEVGTATSDAKGEWLVELPGPGTYEVRLGVDSLPNGLQTRDEGGEVLKDVRIRPGDTRTVIFPLIPGGAAQEAPANAGTAPPGEATADQPDTGDEAATAAPPPAAPGTPFLDRALQLVVEGIKLGAIIAITAVGLSLVFGTTGLINFAHGELVALGAVVAYVFSTGVFALPLILAGAIAVVVGAMVGGTMEWGLWKPLRARGAGLIQMFIISIGVSLLLRHLILVFFGSRRLQYDQYNLQQEVSFGPVSITPRDLIITILSGIVLLGVALMLQRTRIGKAMRAVADNRDLAESSGIDVDRVVLIVWIVGGGLAALGGVFFGLQQAVYWDMGFNLLLLMFAGVILGGLGSAFGAVVGSLVVGLVAQLSTLWFPTELQNAWALLVLIVVLLVRPQGILGKSERVG